MASPLTDKQFEQLLRGLDNLPPPNNILLNTFFDPTLLPTEDCYPESCLSYFPSLPPLIEEDSSSSVEEQEPSKAVRLL